MSLFPNIDPVALQLGPFAIRWYSLAYIVGIGIGFYICKKPLITYHRMTLDDILTLMTYLMIGILVGGRLGYVILYDLPFYLNHPLKVLSVWEGGMAYHGAAIGSVLGIAGFAKKYKKDLLGLLDLLGLGASIGIGLGRIANFINGELYGRVTHMPWGMVFPSGGPLPRHPSQLYEAFFEGFLLFFILLGLSKWKKFKKGILFGIYLILYGSFRFFLEFFREPDPQIGYLFLQLSLGQYLCILMIFLGLLVLWWKKIRHNQ